MKKVILITGIALLSLGINSCSDNEQLESGKINACKLMKSEKLLRIHPDSVLLQKEVKNLKMYVKLNRESYASYGMGSNDEFNKEIDEYLQSCK